MTDTRSDWLPQPVIYRVNGDGVITRVNEAWRLFAVDNGEDDLGDGAVGKRLWDYLTDPTLARIYHDLLRLVSASGRAVTFAYRCDSPVEKRHMEMTIRPIGDEVEFENRFVSIEPQTPRAFFDRMVKDPEAVPICSICQRLKAEGMWADALETFDAGRLRLEDSPMALAPTLCPECKRTLEGKAAGAGC
ncbi:MAG: PAS domain-containing protein [Pseudomonadota bacterium]